MLNPNELINVKNLATFVEMINRVTKEKPGFICFSTELTIPRHNANISFDQQGWILTIDGNKAFWAHRLPLDDILAEMCRVVKLATAQDRCDEKFEKAIQQLASAGEVFIEGFTAADIKKLESLWSDAYGEDHWETYLRRQGCQDRCTTYHGYIKTRLIKLRRNSGHCRQEQ